MGMPLAAPQPRPPSSMRLEYQPQPIALLALAVCPGSSCGSCQVDNKSHAEDDGYGNSYSHGNPADHLLQHGLGKAEYHNGAEAEQHRIPQTYPSLDVEAHMGIVPPFGTEHPLQDAAHDILHHGTEHYAEYKQNHIGLSHAAQSHGSGRHPQAVNRAEGHM